MASLLTVLVCAIISESYLHSDGFDVRKETFGCLVEFLKGESVDDENFSVADSLDLSSANCSEIVSKQNQSFYEDLTMRTHCFYPKYNLTDGECERANITNDSQRNCEDMARCLVCILRKLSLTDYEAKRFHASAVNVTVIEFKIWKYFSISTRVVELSMQVKESEEASLDECQEEESCKPKIDYCL